MNDFINLLFMSEYGFCPMNNDQDCRQNEYSFSLQGIVQGPLSESDCYSLASLAGWFESHLVRAPEGFVGLRP